MTPIEKLKELEAKEELLPIPGFPGYIAGEDGYIYSIHMSRGKEARRLKGTPNSYGYLVVRIKYMGGYTTKAVHRLICRAFHGDKPQKDMMVCHSNGIKTDNRPCNLRWGTAKDNFNDSLLHGLRVDGEYNRFASLKNDEITAAEILVNKGMSIGYIASFLNVSRNTLRDAINGKHYKKRNEVLKCPAS